MMNINRLSMNEGIEAASNSIVTRVITDRLFYLTAGRHSSTVGLKRFPLDGPA